MRSLISKAVFIDLQGWLYGLLGWLCRLQGWLCRLHPYLNKIIDSIESEKEEHHLLFQLPDPLQHQFHHDLEGRQGHYLPSTLPQDRVLVVAVPPARTTC